MRPTFAAALTVVALLAAFCLGCSAYENLSGSETDSDTIASVDFDETDLESGVPDSPAATITFDGAAASIAGSGASLSGSVVTIASSGAYKLSGTWTEGQIRVDAGDEDVVRLILDGASITCSSAPPLYVVNASKALITLVAGSENSLTDGSAYASSEVDAALYSADDLTINGGGSLVVTGLYNDGLRCKDGLKIVGGSIAVTAVNDGIKGRDFIVIRDGELEVTAGGDCLQAYNDEDEDAGFILVEGGQLSLVSGQDGMQAESGVRITGGSLDIVSGGGSSKTASDSAKGIKAASAVAIEGGSLVVSSADDAIHCDGDITISGGTLSLAANASGGQGIKFGDSAAMTISGDATSIGISSSYEGIAGYKLSVTGGRIAITATNDGFSMSAGTVVGGSESNDGSSLSISGGYIAVYVSAGDGVDSNGTIAVSGGTLIVHGPVAQPEVAIDYNGSFTISGGLVVATANYNNMVLAPSSASSQCSFRVILSASQAAATLIHIQDSSGADLLSFKPSKSYQSLIFSSPELATGKTYSVYYGGSSSGSESDGLYSGGSYTAGTLFKTVTPTSVITTVGTASGGVQRS